MKPAFFSENRRIAAKDRIKAIRNNAFDAIKYMTAYYIDETIEIKRVIEGFGDIPVALTGIINAATINDNFSVEFTVEYIHPTTGETMLTFERL
jgi:hypothetical protein